MIIVGARGKIDVEKTIEKLKKFKFAQVMDATCVCGEEHVIVAYEHAKRAFENGRNVCRDMTLEFLLYASGKRQIKDAIEFIGAKEEGEYVFVFDGVDERKAIEFVEEMGLEIDEKVIAPSVEKLKKFGISEEEMETVGKPFYYDLIFEKIAMVELMK